MNNEYTILLNVDLGKNKPNTLSDKSVGCPFCDKQRVIDDGLMLENKGDMAWVKNKFPILEDTYQTLIIETNRCGENFTTYSLEYAKNLFAFMFACREKMIKSGEFKDVIFFKNQGLNSGASIFHSHSQIVGLKNATYAIKPIEESLEGPVVYEDSTTRVTVSKVPRAEFYEFNVIWDKKDTTQTYVEWVQTIIKYFSIFKKGEFDSYNLMHHETSTHHIIKVIPRKANSIFYLGFGLRQCPSDTDQIAEEIRRFIDKNRLF